KPTTPSAWAYIFIGVVVAFTVPLFLNLTQSSLVPNILNKVDGYVRDLLVLTGVCIVAAVSSRAFLDRLSARILDQLNQTQKEVKETQQKVSQQAPEVEQAKNLAAEAVATSKAAVDQTELLGEAVDASDTAARAEAQAAVTQMSAQELQQIALSEEESKVLNALHKMPYRTIAGLVRDSELPREKVSDLIDSLVAKRVATPTASPKTGGPRYRITDRGIAALNAAQRPPGDVPPAGPG
ncbi:MAG: hypothetical protein JO273_20425, partial [Methylobacteriaceae bacterium]|nr:hypothetical protein [Methylobacteriaceae bacterium]